MTEGPYKLHEGWRWVRLGEVCETKMGGTPSTKDAQYWEPPEIVLVTPEDLEKCELNRVFSSRRLISRTGLKKSSAKLFQHKTVLLSTTATIGKVGVAEKPLSANQQISGIICGDNVNPEFLAYYLLRLGETGLKQLGGTATATHINQTNLRSLPIPLPPFEEQRRIVARIEELMARVREARRLRQQAKEDAERLMQAALAETFPRPGTEPPPGWRWVRLGEVAQVFSGTWGTDPTSADLDDRVLARVIRVSDVKETLTIDYDTVPLRSVSRREAKRLALRSGDVIVVKSSGSKAKVISGRAALFSKREELFSPSNFVFAVRGKTENVHPAFLWHWLNAAPARQYIEQIVSTFTYPNLKKADYVKLPIPLPPLEEQRRIVAHLEAVQEKVNVLKEIQATTDAELQRLEQAILDRAFRGEL